MTLSANVKEEVNKESKIKSWTERDTKNGKLIEQVEQAKLLSVTLDCHLSWEKHIENTCSIVNSRLSLLRRIKPLLNHHCALRFFNSCIHNPFIYCSSAWGNCSNYLLSCLCLLQKRAARLLLDADYSQLSVSLISKLKWLPILDLIKLRKLVLVFTILNNPASPLCLQRNTISCLLFVQLVCAPDLMLLILSV